MNGTLSVVIATLGGEILFDTVKSINEGTVVPDEVLLCVPEENAQIAFSNMRVQLFKTVICELMSR